jgi:hypothetical protein
MLTLKAYLHGRFLSLILQCDAIWPRIILLKLFCIAIAKVGIFLFLSNTTDCKIIF